MSDKLNGAGTFLSNPPETRRFKAMIGTGGIGSGSLFLLSGNHTLGREESRGGKYLDAKDYCKLHIIEHYVKVLMGPGFPVFPVGKVGDDLVGQNIYSQMKHTGLDVTYVDKSAGDRTLFGFCFLYPDGTGGNLTTEESACTKVDPVFIEATESLFRTYDGNFISLAAPEVPMNARLKFMEMSRRFNGFCVASFTSGEMTEAINSGMLQLADLIAINKDEAAALIHRNAAEDKTTDIVHEVVARVKRLNENCLISITAGKEGSWTWDGNNLNHVPAFEVTVASSAGAGDAHIAGIISGLTAGLPLQHAQLLGTMAAAYSVTSPHTIHPDLNRIALAEFAIAQGVQIEPSLSSLLAIPKMEQGH